MLQCNMEELLADVHDESLAPLRSEAIQRLPILQPQPAGSSQSARRRKTAKPETRPESAREYASFSMRCQCIYLIGGQCVLGGLAELTPCDLLHPESAIVTNAAFAIKPNENR